MITTGACTIEQCYPADRVTLPPRAGRMTTARRTTDEGKEFSRVVRGAARVRLGRSESALRFPRLYMGGETVPVLVYRRYDAWELGNGPRLNGGRVDAML